MTQDVLWCVITVLQHALVSSGFLLALFEIIPHTSPIEPCEKLQLNSISTVYPDYSRNCITECQPERAFGTAPSRRVVSKISQLRCGLRTIIVYIIS